MTNFVSKTGTGSSDRLRRPAGLRALRLGELTVTYVPDGAVQLAPRAWLPAS
ncbi:MAG: hypothetical protein QOF38_4291, partial [Pseudonocardiales bacterium]|nr:hypothetical protein [Pseudonocardiales bacterium]